MTHCCALQVPATSSSSRLQHNVYSAPRAAAGGCLLLLQALLSELMGWGVTPSCVHYECLAESYALHQDVAAAEQVFDRMQAAGHTPLLRSYNRLLNGIAMYGDMAAATRIYARFKAQGLKPDEQMMRALFKCVRLYASRVRVETARKQALAKPGDT